MLFDAENRLVIGKGVTLKPYRERPFIQREFMTETEIRENVGSDLILDAESYPNYFMCGFKHPPTGKFIRLDKNFNPQFLSWLLHSYRTIGFNSKKFDLVLLWAAYVNQDPEFLKDVTNALIFQSLRQREAEAEFNFKCYPTKHIDLIEVAPLKGSLKLYGARIHVPRIQDLPFPDDQRLTPSEMEIVCNYNYNDLDVTQSLKDFMKERLALREDISARYNEDVMSKSDAQIAEVVISKEVAKATGKFIKKVEIAEGAIYKYSRPSYIRYATTELQKLLADVLKSDFVVNFNGGIDTPPLLDKRTIRVGDLDFSFGIGGLHSCEKCISYVADDEYDIIDRDVTSYYPDIILTLGLYPETLGPAFLKVFRGFKDERVVAKRNKNFTYDKGLKIFINGASGKLNSKYSRMHSPRSYIQMTLTGQLSILMLVEILVCNGIKVISGNTDGIVIYCKKSDYAKLEELIAFWENETQYKTEETRYTGYYARDVNAYFALKTDGTVKVKGSFAEVGSQSGTQLDTNPEVLICSDAIKAFLSKGKPIEETIRECQDITRFVTIRNVKGGAHKDGEYLGKIVRWFYGINEYGTINYVSSGNKVAKTEGAIPCLDLPTVFPENINHQWYIDNCKEILYDIGVRKRPSQIRFF